jgi:hypothetical protein
MAVTGQFNLMPLLVSSTSCRRAFHVVCLLFSAQNRVMVGLSSSTWFRVSGRATNDFSLATAHALIGLALVGTLPNNTRQYATNSVCTVQLRTKKVGRCANHTEKE